MSQAAATPLPPYGYREVSGLFIPEDTPREREVWTSDERKLFNRAMKLLSSRGIRLQFCCADDRCSHTAMESLALPDGSAILRCAHKDRVLSRVL